MSMYLVYDNEEGLVYLGDSLETAEKEYEKCVEAAEKYVNDDGEFTGDERIVLAKVIKQTYSRDSGKPVISIGENGEDIESKTETYWEFHEEVEQG